MEILRSQKKKNQNFTASVVVNQTEENVFAAINNIRGWWSEDVDGSTNKLHHEFMYRDKHLWCRMKVTELIPGKKIVWHVLESEIDNFEGGKEWDDTKLIFEITKNEDKTEIKFTHFGLGPDLRCYAVCSKAWSFYIKSSLQRLITTGKRRAD
jgi:hypothetical protein